MKTKNIFLSLFALPMLFACSAEQEMPEVEATAELQLTTKIETSRAGINATYFSKGDQIGVFAYRDDAAKKSWNVKGTTNDGVSWIFDSPVKLYNEYTILEAYYPWSEFPTVENYYGFLVDITTQTNYLVGSAEVNNMHPMVTMDFRHITSKLAFNITNDNVEAKLQSVSVTTKGLPTFGHYEFGSYKVWNTASEVSSKNIVAQLTPGKYKAEILLLPGSKACTQVLTVAYDNGKSYNIEFTVPALEMNGCYAYNVKIAGEVISSIEISNPVITSWNDPITMGETVIK